MPDSIDLTLVIEQALKDFYWSSYGYDDLSEDMVDPSLDIQRDLTSHLVEAVQSTLDRS
jgi:hypothetical protein